MAIDFESIRAVAVVAERGSFQDAAQVLNISAPALTRRIQKLEAGLGVELLKRTTRRVDVTIPGQQFLPIPRVRVRILEDDAGSVADRVGHQEADLGITFLAAAMPILNGTISMKIAG